MNSLWYKSIELNLKEESLFSDSTTYYKLLGKYKELLNDFKK